MVRMGVLLSSSPYLPVRVLLLLTWIMPGPGFFIWNATVGHKTHPPNQPTKTPNNNNNNNFLQKYHWTFLVKSFSVPYHEAINTFPQTTLPSTNIQGCMLGTVPTGFLSGFHSPHPGSFQPKQEQVQPHPKARGHAQMAKMSGRLYCGGRKRKNPPRIHEERADKNLARTLVQCQAP